MPSKIQIVVVSADKRLTQFMQAADVFEPSKVIGRATVYAVTLEPGRAVGPAVEGVRAALEKLGTRVVACFSPDDPAGRYRDDSVKVVSDGRGWSTLDSMLRTLGWTDTLQPVEPAEGPV